MSSSFVQDLGIVLNQKIENLKQRKSLNSSIDKTHIHTHINECGKVWFCEAFLTVNCELHHTV